MNRETRPTVRVADRSGTAVCLGARVRVPYGGVVVARPAHTDCRPVLPVLVLPRRSVDPCMAQLGSDGRSHRRAAVALCRRRHTPPDHGTPEPCPMCAEPLSTRRVPSGSSDGRRGVVLHGIAVLWPTSSVRPRERCIG